MLLCFFLCGCGGKGLPGIAPDKKARSAKTALKKGAVTTAESSRDKKEAAEKTALQPKKWNVVIKKLDNLDVTIEVEWAADIMYYQVKLVPTTDEIFKIREKEEEALLRDQQNPSITFHFCDENGSALIKENVFLLSMTEMRKVELEPPTALEYQGSSKCDKSTYTRIAGARVTWVLPEYGMMPDL